jgi:hypothetical protein
MERNETLWQAIDQTVLTATTPASCYRELACALAERAAGDDVWLQQAAAAMHIWCDLFATDAAGGCAAPRSAAASEVLA